MPDLSPLFTTQFSTALDLKLQQMGSLLRPHVEEQGGLTGKLASPVQQVGAVVAKAPQGRFVPKDFQAADFTRRWFTPSPYEINQLVDEYDMLETIVDPKSPLTTGAAQAIGRIQDDVIIAAATGSAQIGTDAASLTTESFDTTKFQVAHDFGASATTGMTVAKIIEGQRILQHYHNDLDRDPPCLIIGSSQYADLLKQAQVVSADFNGGMVLENGRLKRFMGCDIVVSERLAVASSDRTCLMFVKSGIKLGLWRDLSNRISIAEWLSGNPWLLWTSTMIGATRTQPGKVVSILCNDTSGSDITP